MASGHKSGSLDTQLSKRTSIFGLRLWVVAGICLGAAFVILLFIIFLWLACKFSRSKKGNPQQLTIPTDSKEIQEICFDCHEIAKPCPQFIPNPLPKPETAASMELQTLPAPKEESPIGTLKNHLESHANRRIGNELSTNCDTRLVNHAAMVGPEVSHLGWGHWYTLRELEASTNGFSDENVVGEGGYGIVYRGVLEDNSLVAIKNLHNNRGQADKEFKVEVETIGRVRHKNLVRLLGYCVEGAYRMLVYEYVDNGNLEQWLHGDVGPFSPLTWEIRMKIILGTAKGLMYLHEGLEPKVVHRDVKSSNILLDRNWNPKVSDFGLAKLLGSERSYVTTRVMGTFGYVAPEYASTGMLNERSDVYSFGVLIMEIISGRNPVDYSRPPEEVNLVDWVKALVLNRNTEGALDPKMPEKPPPRALKRALLVALRCIDPDAQKRPRMGHVINMIEVDDSPFRDDRRARHRGHTRSNSSNEEAKLLKKLPEESGESSGCETSSFADRTRSRRTQG